MLFRVIAGHPRAWSKFRAAGLLDRGPLSLREREIVARSHLRTDADANMNGASMSATFADAAKLTEAEVKGDR